MIEIKLPIRLVSEANNTDHWRVKHNRNKKIKLMLKKYWPKDLHVKFPCKITLTRVAPRQLDDDNLVFCFKFVRDEISDYLIPGMARGRADGGTRLEYLYKQRKGEPKEYGLIIRLLF